MRLLHLLALLPAVTLAQEQVPLQEKINSWFEKVKGYIPTQQPSPVDAGAATVAAHRVHQLTTNNWQSMLSPSPDQPGPETWMVLVTGGNRTCQGRCGRLNAEFNKTAALLSVDKNAPKMGLINCDTHAVLCSTWMAGPPSLWYIQLPVYDAAAQSPASTDAYVKHLNLTTTTASGLVKFYKSEEWKELDRIDSVFHPFDGALAKYGLQVPLGYVLFAFSMVPSWSIMLGVSFFTRYFM